MGKIAFLFAGQGAQYSGMGRSLYDLGGKPKAFFDVAERIKSDLKPLCFSGSYEELSDTANTQSCVFAVDLAAAYALTDSGIIPDGAAGFSLGELAALTFAESFDDETGFSLVCERGRLMARDAAKSKGAMAAVLKLSNAEVKDICEKFERIYPVNYNCEGQLVAAGAAEEMDAFCDEVKKNRGAAKMLVVSGAFHSPFMKNAAGDFKKLIAEKPIKPPEIPVYSNLTAERYPTEKDEIIDLLSRQIHDPVLWEKTIVNMMSNGFDTFIEVGAGKTLSGLVKRIVKSAKSENTDKIKIYNVEDEASLLETVAAIRAVGT